MVNNTCMKKRRFYHQKLTKKTHISELIVFEAGEGKVWPAGHIRPILLALN